VAGRANVQHVAAPVNIGRGATGIPKYHGRRKAAHSQIFSSSALDAFLHL
jgi:hypothetical protein